MTDKDDAELAVKTEHNWPKVALNRPRELPDRSASIHDPIADAVTGGL